MTITRELLDELERKASHNRCVLLDPDVTLHLVAIARAALVLMEKLERQGFVSRLSDAANPLYAALRGTP